MALGSLDAFFFEEKEMEFLHDTLPNIVIQQDGNTFSGSDNCSINNDIPLTFQFTGPIVVQCSELDLKDIALLEGVCHALSNIINAQPLISEIVDMMHAHHTGDVISENSLDRLFTPSNETILRTLLNSPIER